MPADVIVLAGGRSSRLDGVAKASLLLDDQTLLQHAIAAARVAHGRIVVVGPETDSVAADVRFTREEPVFGGPGAAIAAGLLTLRAWPAAPADVPPQADLVAVLACDMPSAAPALAAVLATAEAVHGEDADPADRADGWVAVDESGRAQHLLAVYRVASLERRIAALEAERPTGDLDGIAVRHLVAGLALQTVVVPVGGSDDVDTWSDAARLGIATPTAVDPSGGTLHERSAAPDSGTELDSNPEGAA